MLIGENNKCEDDDFLFFLNHYSAHQMILFDEWSAAAMEAWTDINNEIENPFGTYIDINNGVFKA